MDTPQHLLTDVYWSFAEPVPANPEALIDAVAAYAANLETTNPESLLRVRLPFADLVIRYSHGFGQTTANGRNVKSSIASSAI